MTSVVNIESTPIKVLKRALLSKTDCKACANVASLNPSDFGDIFSWATNKNGHAIHQTSLSRLGETRFLPVRVSKDAFLGLKPMSA